ncbi:glutathione S-transferase 1-like [Epargyreus clarus]|uniref:glutathione S-transferase 1-like n=1 Tax=Epargyreus clarus TaxID=520877 RepID=UPI003C2B3AA7
MPVVVYKMDASPPARAVLLVADIIGLDIETREVNLFAKEQLQPEFLEKNPMHTIPVMEDKGLVLADSHAIIIYLVSKYGADKRAELYPNDLGDRAIVHQRLFLDASILFPRLHVAVKNVLFGNATSIEEDAIAHVEEAYVFLEKYLEASPFIAGEHLTIADISCVTTVSSLNVVVPIDEKFPRLQAWLEFLSNEDWYQKGNQQGIVEFGILLTSKMQQNAE